MATLPTEDNPRAPQIELMGKVYDRIPNKEENPEEYVCLDCEAEDGQIHELGCDVETCPRCGGQLISCGCVRDDQYIWAGMSDD
jgi:hypothetical protein